MIRLIFTPERHHSSHSVIPATMAQGYHAVKSNMVFIIFLLCLGRTHILIINIIIINITIFPSN